MLFVPAFIEVKDEYGRRSYIRVSNINEVYERKEGGQVSISKCDGSMDFDSSETLDAVKEKIQEAINLNNYWRQPSYKEDWINRWYMSVGEDGKPQNNAGDSRQGL